MAVHATNCAQVAETGASDTSGVAGPILVSIGTTLYGSPLER